jgi:23S rRNA pseudouridine2604 synthase
MPDHKPGSQNSSDSSELVRLSKLMSERGLCSRREADDLISKGQVFVDGVQIKELGTKVTRAVKVELGARALQKQSQLVTVILNKPIGYVSAQPEPGYTPAIQLLTAENFEGPGEPPLVPQRLNDLAVTGRLDIDSQGILVFTQDGRIAKHLIGENSEVEKEYLVRVQGPEGQTGKSFLSRESLNLMRSGLEMDGKKLKPAHIEWINEDQLRVVLIEGKKRQVRRMCDAVGLVVKGLKRVRIGQLMLGNLPEGKWRFLDPSEKF